MVYVSCYVRHGLQTTMEEGRLMRWKWRHPSSLSFNVKIDVVAVKRKVGRLRQAINAVRTAHFGSIYVSE